MIFDITSVPRPVDDIDISDLTTAVRLGPAEWNRGNGKLQIQFDRDLTPTEVAAITLRFTSASPEQEDDLTAIDTYLALPAPNTAQNTAQIQLLSTLVRGLITTT